MAERAEVMKLAVQSGVYDLDAIRKGYNEFAKGGRIHIKPENRGKFTALKERTGHSDTWFKQNGTPAQREMATFALNAIKWKHAMGGSLDEEEDYPKGYWENRREHKPIQSRYKRTQKDEEYWAAKQKRNNEAAEKLNRSKDTVMSALSNIADSTPFTGDQVADAAEAQRQEKVEKARELKLGLDATMTAAELTAAGYGVLRGLTHANRWLARQATQSTGQAISRGAMQNLLKWNNRVNKIDKAQVAMNTLGGIADGYQWATANNSFDAWENGLETGANAAGVVGGMNWFRDLPYLRRIGGDKIDAVLDGMGYSAAAWDVVKNLPPLSGALEGIREQSKSNEEEKACGGNLYPGGGFMGLMPAMPGIVAGKEGKDFLSKAYHGIKQFIDLEDTGEELRQKRNADRYASNGYIGGEPRDTRQKYFNVDKEFTDSVNSISKRYGLNPSVVASRIAEEGPVDQAIIDYNDENSVGTQGQILSDNGSGTHGPLWGLDDFYTRVQNNDVKVTTTAPHTYKKQNFINEKGRETESITSPQWWFGIEATAAEMKARRDKLKKNNPWMNNQQLDAATAMSFNYGEAGVQNHINSKKPIPKRFNPYIKTK